MSTAVDRPPPARPPMPRGPHRGGATAGHLRAAALVGVAAALGTLVGLGIRQGRPFGAFASAAFRLRRLPEFVTPDRSIDLSTLLGVAHAVALAYLWAMVAGALGRRIRGWIGLLLLGALAAAVAALDPHLPAALRLAAGALSAGERLVVALALVGAAGLAARAATTLPRATESRAPDRDSGT